MSTIFPFRKSLSSAPTFTPTFDGAQYLVSVPFSFYGQRYYIQCNALDGTLIYLQALQESPPGLAIQTLTWDEATQTSYGTTDAPHGFKIGSTTRLTISGASPDGYNGVFLMLATGPNSFSFPCPFASDPGNATIPGIMSFDINMNGAYFNSTLVYRNGAFIVSP